MGTRTVKGVDDTTWNHLKHLASSEDKDMGDMLKKVIQEYTKDSDAAWDRILHKKKLLTDREADEVMEEITKLRKEPGWRI